MRFIIIMKIINMTHSVHALLTLKTDTMYLSGINSIAKVYLFFDKVEFYSKAECTRVYSFYRKYNANY